MALIWFPQVENIADNELAKRVGALVYSGRTPCHEAMIAMLSDLSHHILNHHVARHIPQYVALAYWLRPAALKRLCQQLTSKEFGGFVQVPRGVALHLPPTNVDTIFVYSWAMSVLAGNANVVRLGETLSTDTQWLVSTTTEVVAKHGESDRQLFCHYNYGGEGERLLAENIDLRMIWGGDEKVKAVSSVPIRPDGLSIGFPDRRSLAIIAVDAYDNADASTRDRLAESFYNDVFWFDQMGCGSPRLLVWLGDPGELAQDFYDRLIRIIRQREYDANTGVAIGKFALANDMLAEGVIQHYHHFNNALDVNRASNAAAALERSHGGGFLSDWVASSIEEVAGIVTRKVQTLTYFGVSSDGLRRLSNGISGRGGYRIVPIGQALQFDPTWDGVDLFQHMTRRIIIR